MMHLTQSPKNSTTIITIAITIFVFSFTPLESPADGFSDFLEQNALRVASFSFRTNQFDYLAEMQLVNTEHTNQTYECYVSIQDVNKLREKDQLRHEREKKRKSQIINKNRTSTNLVEPFFIDYGDDLVFIHSAKPLNAKIIKEYFPGLTFFSTSSTDGSYNPSFVSQPLVIGPNVAKPIMSDIVLLANAPTVAAFMTRYKKVVSSLDEARARVDLFSELQSWQLCKEIPDSVSGWQEADNADWLSKWIYREEVTDKGWRFSGVFLTDPAIRSYSRFELNISQDGCISATPLEYLGSSTNYE